MKTILIENKPIPTMETGWGNGYVLIPAGHPLHGKHYDDIDVEVHGGLTFSELVDEDLLATWPVNHGLTQEDVGGWLVGFDTCHYMDNLANWPKEAVQAEADSLAQQLKNHTS